MAATLKQTTLEFQMVYDPTDTDLVAIEAAYEARTVLDFAAADDDITTDGTRYLRFDGQVFNFTQTESLEEAVMVSVTIKPTFSANAPAVVIVGAS
jgi:hypothetical protein